MSDPSVMAWHAVFGGLSEQEVFDAGRLLEEVEVDADTVLMEEGEADPSMI